MISLEFRRLIADLTFFFKIVNNIVKIDFGDLIVQLNSVTRGHSKRFAVPPARINCRAHFFLNRTIPIWNKLSERSIQSSSVTEFKQSILLDKFAGHLVFDYY